MPNVVALILGCLVLTSGLWLLILLAETPARDMTAPVVDVPAEATFRDALFGDEDVSEWERELHWSES